MKGGASAQHFDCIDEKLEEVQVQARKTNGRATKLKRWSLIHGIFEFFVISNTEAWNWRTEMCCTEMLQFL